MKWICPLLFIILLSGCALNKSESKSPRVFVRSGGKIDTTYLLAQDRTISQSMTKDKSGKAITRLYSYNAQKELRSISTSDASGASKTVYLATETSKDGMDRSSKIARTIVGSRGEATQYDIQYLYDPDGRLVAVMQTDTNGNVQIKTLKDGGLMP